MPEVITGMFLPGLTLSPRCRMKSALGVRGCRCNASSMSSSMSLSRPETRDSGLWLSSSRYSLPLKTL